MVLRETLKMTVSAADAILEFRQTETVMAINRHMPVSPYLTYGLIALFAFTAG
jgi:hypothetical protein